ncbi:MAG: type II CAAX endopeptidase family protein [Polyangiaceae bacterium]
MQATSRRRGSGAARALALHAAAGAVLLLTRFSPTFHFLGERGGLFGWLAYLTAVTAGLPAAVGMGALGLSRADVGLTWGDARRDRAWIVLGIACAIAAAWVVTRAPEVRAYYPHYRPVRSNPALWIPSTLAFAAYGLAWETLFRGFVLLGTRDSLGRWALVTQTAMFALGHASKPTLELWLSVPAGLVFGLAALRTRSVLPGFLVHATLSLAVNLFCVYA